MSKLLPTRLPISLSPQVESDTYNRLVRVLELNLGQFDPDNTRQMNTVERNEVFFNIGSLVFNTITNTLQRRLILWSCNTNRAQTSCS